MKYAQEWHRQISPISGEILMFFCISIFILYQFFIFVQLRANTFIREAQVYLIRAQGLEGEDLIVERAIFYKRAIKFLARAIKFNPFDAGTYFVYAESINSKMSQDAQLAGVFDLGSLYPAREEKNLSFADLARRNFAEAIKRNPTNAIYHQRLGSIYEKLSNDIQAEAELKKAILLDPQNVSIHLYLTQYYLSRNKQSEFNYHLGRVVELYRLALTGGGPMERLGNMVRQYLESIKQEELLKD
jgi:tetratricopeptide (TPR) repeat protein